MRLFKRFTPLFIFLAAGLAAVTVDLREPTYSDGILTTEKGGVITGENLRIQAQKIRYTHDSVEAEEDLIVEFGNYIFVGEKLYFSFPSNTGTITDGRTGQDPWFLGGDLIHLREDGSYKIDNAYITTSENIKTDWAISTKEAILRHHRFLTTRNVFFKFLKVPIFWLPGLKLNVKSLLDAPIRYTFRWGGSQGPRVGMLYEIYHGERWRAFLQLDYRYNRGFGGGFQTAYKSLTGCEKFHTVNYIAEDWTRFDRKNRVRYRFQGFYSNALNCGKTTVNLNYDKLSDKDMATDYHDKGLKLRTALPTELTVRHEEKNWIHNFLTRVRINDFQSLKEELPTLTSTMRPHAIANTGIIMENQVEGSYLEFEYQDRETVAKDYNSTRFEFSNRLYRPFHSKYSSFTPEAGLVAIYYGNNPDGNDKWVTLGRFGVQANTNINKVYNRCKHVITPYLYYQLFTDPTTNPDEHYIFDINDGWFRLNILRYGIEQNWYRKTAQGCIYRKLYADIWANAFVNTSTIPTFVPKIYSRVVYSSSPYLRHTLTGAWDFDHQVVDHFNYLVQWTVTDEIAISSEFRHRSSFDWRKVDRQNFILDSFRSDQELRDSALSDRRNTFLVHLYYRFHPNWAFEIESRHGWRRLNQPSYTEYQVDLLGSIRSAWKIKLAYRHREDDERFFINISLGIDRPDCCPPCPAPPCLEF